MFHTEFFTIFFVDYPTCLMGIELDRGNGEIGHVKRKETVALETARILLWQHKRLAYYAIGIDMAEIRACIETVVAA